MLNAVVVGTLVGLAALVAMALVLLVPAALLARFLRRGDPRAEVIVRPVAREISVRAAYARPR